MYRPPPCYRCHPWLNASVTPRHEPRRPYSRCAISSFAMDCARTLSDTIAARSFQSAASVSTWRAPRAKILLPNEVLPVSDIAKLQDLIGNTPLVQLRIVRRRPLRAVPEARKLQPGRIDQGSHRPLDDRSRRARRQNRARLDAGRSHGRQHGLGPGAGRGAKGISG